MKWGAGNAGKQFLADLRAVLFAHQAAVEQAGIGIDL
jgi:hypothetical protein